ncbi:tyrosine phosphatase-like protein, PTPLA [Oesophagostomum dentatum]|uniref:Very-long-chain (3R)-3-hydroxyacyl-CoA dehydratase n=1 Tax=Oesophagostomum dentatum TaxID=61180 RepID=A0A0B1S5K2_OESDE|nr:tyrosine phosphatase-like protein, PTPLA [Oesophagostomum dentatum]
MKPAQLYLFAYNAVQVLGWGIILLKTLYGLFERRSWPELYNSVEVEVKIFQTLAILEIVHAAVGLVRSPVGTTAMQVWSRLLLVWPILYNCATARRSVGVPMLLTAWSVTEVIRYSFYALGLFGAVPSFLTWMRYTLFIVLYPLGVSGELLTLIGSLPEVAEKKYYTIEMPNPANMGFSFYAVLIISALMYIPGFPQLYLYMFAQRKKVLCVDAAKKRQ